MQRGGEGGIIDAFNNMIRNAAQLKGAQGPIRRL